MAKLHILTAGSPNLYRIVVHSPTPNGNNSAGVAWSTAIKNSGRAFTSMTEGNTAGLITTAEKNDVENGVVLEAEFDFQDDINYTPAQRNAALDAYAAQVIAELQARLQQELKFFGATRN